MKPKEIKELAYSIFKKYNSKSIFENDGNKITVSKSGINESIEKIFNNKIQRNLLKEHLQVFSDLGDIIEHATLINQSGSSDVGTEENSWHYYYDNLDIKGEKYTLVFDVVSRNNGENHYRVQRLEKQNIIKEEPSARNIANSNITLTYEDSTSANNIPQSDNNVNSDTSTKYSMPIGKDNTLNNNSSSEIIRSCINEAIEDEGENGRFDTDRNTEELYERIWSYAEKELGRELN